MKNDEPYAERKVTLVDINNGVSVCLVPDVDLPATADTFSLGAHYTPSRLYEMKFIANWNEIEKKKTKTGNDTSETCFYLLIVLFLT